MEIKAKAKVDYKTKNLAKRIGPGEIAVICHPDLDEIAAQSLVEAKVKAVINAQDSITGRYPNQGPSILIRAGIPLIDKVGPEIMDITEGDTLTIKDGKVFSGEKLLASGQRMTEERLGHLLETTKSNLDQELNKFITNTLNYVFQEKDTILYSLQYPAIDTDFRGRYVVIVVRGQGYKEDLNAIKPFIKEERPVLIGVDGGADALLEIGYKPDLIIGDMDSISDNALKCGAELIVHAYQDGHAPGTKRLDLLDLCYKLFSAPGTSEDIAMLLAHQQGADLMVAVGTHSNMIDFLEKGRKGMSSTFLVRLKVGPQLVDAKGVSKLYQPKSNYKNLAHVFLAGLIPIFLVFSISPMLNQMFKIFILKLRLFIRV